MPAVAPFVPLIASGISGGLGILGGRASKKGSSQSNIFDQMAQKNLGASSDYFQSVLKNPAEATATRASDLGKQFQQGVNFNARNVTRGGGSAARIAEAPFQLASAAKGQQILAQMGAAGQLGDLGGTAGRLGLGAQGLDLERTQQNRAFWSDIGSSIGGFLTNPNALAKGSILGRIFAPKQSPIQGTTPGGYQGTQVGLPGQTIPRGWGNDLGEP